MLDLLRKRSAVANHVGVNLIDAGLELVNLLGGGFKRLSRLFWFVVSNALPDEDSSFCPMTSSSVRSVIRDYSAHFT